MNQFDAIDFNLKFIVSCAIIFDYLYIILLVYAASVNDVIDLFLSNCHKRNLTNDASPE